MMFFLYFHACTAANHDSSGGLPSDSSYTAAPALLAVSGGCDAGDVVVAARTIGWTKTAYVYIWSDIQAPSVKERLFTVGFRRDEYCDYVEVRLPADGATAPTCEQLDAGMLTYFLFASYEEGCAGTLVWGKDAAAVLSAEANLAGVDPDPCTVPNGIIDGDSVEAEVLPVIPACDSPLP